MATHGRKISVIGLGYVGLPVAVAFGKQAKTVGFDVDTGRVAELVGGYDRTREVTSAELADTDVLFTADSADLASADFHIVAVPTPIDSAKRPDLRPLLSASRSVGGQLKKGDIVVFESTVYPGATEEDCVPVLENESGLVCGRDFSVGYSPERINPGDQEHSFWNIMKVVSGLDPETAKIVADVYSSVVTAGVHLAPTIKVAEAAKVIENTQRDLNIALMNELALIFDRMDIDTNDVLDAAGTKWNFLKFSPGLVGGHCIGVDPYYLTHKAAMEGYSPQVILAGRRINDSMGEFVAARAVKALIKRGTTVREARVTVLGMSFKENVPDVRNSKVIDVIKEFEDYGIEVQVHDPMVDPEEALHEFGVKLVERDALLPAACVVLAVPHEEYVSGGWPLLQSLLKDGAGVAIDIKSVLPRDLIPEEVSFWRL
ncbi:MAG: nucleotide sugar dehydrogenase [Gammaproteobacteria bacterium]|nr:nucleotide sugar dehydrogenase [Gammaproteobacteria bacterium]